MKLETVRRREALKLISVVSTSPVKRDRMPPVFMSQLRQRQVQQSLE